jgi:hypothetical protein
MAGQPLQHRVPPEHLQGVTDAMNRWELLMSLGSYDAMYDAIDELNPGDLRYMVLASAVAIDLLIKDAD